MPSSPSIYVSFLVVIQIRGHIAGSSPSSFPNADLALEGTFIARKTSALCSLVDSHRTELHRLCLLARKWCTWLRTTLPVTYVDDDGGGGGGGGGDADDDVDNDGRSDGNDDMITPEASASMRKICPNRGAYRTSTCVPLYPKIQRRLGIRVDNCCCSTQTAPPFLTRILVRRIRKPFSDLQSSMFLPASPI